MKTVIEITGTTSVCPILSLFRDNDGNLFQLSLRVYSMNLFTLIALSFLRRQIASELTFSFPRTEIQDSQRIQVNEIEGQTRSKLK